MRAGSRPGIYVLDGTFVAFNLSSDFCAEHEWGIKQLVRDWNRDDITKKIEASEKSLDGLGFSVSNGGNCALMYYSVRTYRKFPANNCDSSDLLTFSQELQFRNYGNYNDPKDNVRTKLVTAWSEADFGILVRSAEYVSYLQQLYDAFRIGDVCMWIATSGNPFENGGFCLAINSRLPEELKTKWKSDYDEKIKLNAASEATGIEQKLKNANKRYYCLQPKWIPKNTESKHPVFYWLNPAQQDIHNYGWFTVEQLEEWCENRGPVIMRNEKKIRSEED